MAANDGSLGKALMQFAGVPASVAEAIDKAIDDSGVSATKNFTAPTGQTVSVPVADAGSVVYQDNVAMTKTGVGALYGYSIDADTTLNAATTSGIRDTTTNWQEVGQILIPGDSLYLAPSATLTFDIAASANLTSCQMAVLVGQRGNTVRTQTKYYTVRDLTSGYASPSARMELLLKSLHPGMLSLAQVQASTAPTAYPDGSKNQVFPVNLLAGVTVRLFVKFATSTSAVSLNSVSANLVVKAPARNQVDITQQYSRAPFEDTDMWKARLPAFSLAKAEVTAANPASTGDQSTGTLNGSGTSGTDTLTVYSTTGVTVGMRPVIGNAAVVTPGVGPIDSFRRHMPDAVATLAAFGSDTTVIAILNSTQVQLSQTLKANVNLRGRVYYNGATDHVPCVAFYASHETVCARMGQGAGTIGANPFTGIQKTATAATAARSCVPVLRIKSTDPVKTWQFTQVNGYNPWVFNTDASNATIGFETYDNGTFSIKTPDITQTWLLNGSQNPDKNLVLITECGRYAIEMIGVNLNSTPATVTRVVVTDQTAKSLVATDVYDLGSISYGTRGYGGPLSGGLIRKFEMDQCYSTGNIQADIARAMDAVKHPVAMLLSTAQAKSNNYCPDPAVQGTKLVYKSYRSARSVHTPAISAGGTGYAVGDVLYVTGGTYTTQMSCVVTAVSAGVVTGIYVQRTGQYKTLPADASVLATTSSGSGTGCVLNALSIPTAPDQTTAAIAFPDITTTEQALQYPASVADNAFATNYAGTIPMGALFSIPSGLDLVAEWTTRRTNAPTALSSSYELLAVLAAIQKYGVYVTDVSGAFQQVIAVDSDFAYSANYANLHGDTGGSTYPNLVAIKRLLTYVENVSPVNRSSTYANVQPTQPPI